MPVSVSRADEASVAALSRGLTQAPRRRARDQWFLVGATEERIAIPETVLHLLTRAVELLARGDAVAVVPVEQYVTTQEAADLLNVSRQYLVRLLDAGTLPFTKTGKHRRVPVEDILRFKTMRDAERAAALDELTRMTEDIGGYMELK